MGVAAPVRCLGRCAPPPWPWLTTLVKQCTAAGLCGHGTIGQGRLTYIE